MANIAWSGATNGTLDTGTNWDGGTAAGASDNALFNFGSVSLTTNLDQIAAFDELTVLPPYTGTMGGSANELKSSINTVKHYGVAEMWLHDLAGLTDNVYIACATTGTIVHLGGDTMTNVNIHRGTVTIDGNMGTIARMIVGSVNNTESDATVTVTSNAGTWTDFEMNGGIVSTTNTITTARQSAGTLTTNGTASIVTMYQAGGRCNYLSTGTITFLYVDGVFDLGDTPKTVTTAIEGPRGRIIFNKTIHTFTNPIVHLNEAAAV